MAADQAELPVLAFAGAAEWESWLASQPAGIGQRAMAETCQEGVGRADRLKA